MANKQFRAPLVIIVSVLFIFAILTLLFFIFGKSKHSIDSAEIIWSYDNAKALVRLSIVDEDSGGNSFHQKLWLTDKTLNPTELIATSYIRFLPTPCFSRDGLSLYFVNLDSTGEKYLLYKRDILNQKNTPLIGFDTMGDNWVLIRYLIEDKFGVLNVLLTSESPPVVKLMRFRNGKLSTVYKFYSPLLRPSFTSTAHLDNFTSTSQNYYMNPNINQLYHLELPLGKDRISSDTVVFTEEEKYLRARSSDHEISLHSEMIFDREAKYPVQFKYTIDFGDGDVIESVSNAIVDRNDIVWIDNNDRSLWHSESDGDAKRIVDRLPKDVNHICSYNSDTGIVCLQSKKFLYIYNIHNASLEKRRFNL